MKVTPRPPHTRAHSHNDEMQPEPLRQALRDGFTSIEVDVYLVKGRLLVGHTPKDALKKNLTLEDAYLRPLRERVEENQGAVYPGGPQVTLMIDFKDPSASERTYAGLKPLLEKYADMLSHWSAGQAVGGAVQVVLTGSEPRVTAEEERLVSLDARLADVLGSSSPANPGLTPTVSGDYKSYFRWNGHGTMPEKEQARLNEIVAETHRQGLQLRLWDAPDGPTAWETLERLGVDRINTDNLDGYAEWRESHPRNP